MVTAGLAPDGTMRPRHPSDGNQYVELGALQVPGSVEGDSSSNAPEPAVVGRAAAAAAPVSPKMARERKPMLSEEEVRASLKEMWPSRWKGEEKTKYSKATREGFLQYVGKGKDWAAKFRENFCEEKEQPETESTQQNEEESKNHKSPVAWETTQVEEVEKEKASLDRQASKAAQPEELDKTEDLRKKLQERQKDIERLQMKDVKEIEKLVKRLLMKDVHNTVLFVTGEQLKALCDVDCWTFLEAIEIKPPRLVITLFSSVAFMEKSGKYVEAMQNKQLQKRFHAHSEVTNREVDRVERDLHWFLKMAVLPLAIEAQALVMVNTNDCLLTKAFSDLCESVSESMVGNRLPFTVLNVACSEHLTYPAMNKSKKGFNAPKLFECQDDPKWRNELAEEWHKETFVKASINSNMSDVVSGCTHYIICNNFDQVRSFQNTLVKNLTKKLPCFAIASLKGGLNYVADYLKRGMPVLLLDTRRRKDHQVNHDEEERSKPSRQRSSSSIQKIAPEHAERHHPELDDEDREMVEKMATELSELTLKLMKAGTWDIYNRCTMAFIHSRMRKAETQRMTKDAKGTKVEEVLLYKAIEQANKTSDHAGRNQRLRLVNAAVDEFRKHHTRQDLVRRIFQKLHLEHHKADLAKTTATDLEGWLKKRSIDWGVLFRRMPHSSWDWMRDQFNEHEHLDIKHCTSKDKTEDSCKLWFEVIKPKATSTTDVVQKAMTDILEVECKYLVESSFDSELSFDSLEHAKHADMLLSNNLFSAKLNSKELPKVAGILHEMIGRSRLPCSNSPQTLHLIRDAWDTIDTYNYVAWRCRLLALMSTCLLLLVNLAISVLTVISLNEPEAISTDTLSTCTVMLAVCGGLIASVTLFFNPMNRWIRLKSAALTLEAELWKFRTRTGLYKVDINSFNDRVSEERLYQYVENVKRTVSKQITLSPLTTQNRGHRKYFYHGQYKHIRDNKSLQYQRRGVKLWKEMFEASEKQVEYELGSESDDDDAPGRDDSGVEEIKGPDGRTQTPGKPNTPQHPGESDNDPRREEKRGLLEDKDDSDEHDDHYSPLEPSEYLKFRVLPILQSYRDRTPGYNRKHVIVEVLLILSQVAGVVLGIFGKGSWTGIAASIAATITSWAGIRGFQKKRERTSSAVETLDSLLLWWFFLQFFDRCNVENVDRLVNMCEDVFERRRDAWVSTASSANVQIQGLLESAQTRSGEVNNQKKSAGVA